MKIWPGRGMPAVAAVAVPVVTAGRVAICRHCGRILLHDDDGRPIHTDLSYVCRDQWGAVTDTYAEPIVPGQAPARVTRECHGDLR